MNQIKNRWNKKIICEGKESIKELAEKNRGDLALADLAGANLAGANLAGANLALADLAGADLSRANLAGAYLVEADLSRAILTGAYLAGADLAGADLLWAYLSGTNLSGAHLEFPQFPSIRLISSIPLNNLPNDLQLELMRRDALAHPHPERFDKWAKTENQCPYQNEERFWLFEPKKELWSPGLPQMTDRDLIIALCKSQGWQIKGYL